MSIKGNNNIDFKQIPGRKKIYVGPINKTRLLHLTLYLIKLIDKRIIMQHNMMIDYTYAGNWSNFNVNENNSYGTRSHKKNV